MQSPQGIHAVCQKFPKLKIVTSEIDSSLDADLRVIPGMGEFGDRYFGTDDDTCNSKVTAQAGNIEVEREALDFNVSIRSSSINKCLEKGLRP